MTEPNCCRPMTQLTSATVAIQFDGFEEQKKLVYRFAKLVLA